MANWTNLKAAIADTINTNGNQEITGAVLQSTLNAIVNAVGANATFAGVATPTTNPGVPDGPVFYLAPTPGLYSNFDAVEVQINEIAIIKFEDNSWKKQSIIKGFSDNILWNSSSNLNNFTNAGVYEITGERKMSKEFDNLPIDNRGSGHTISARLEVLDSSINNTTDSDDKCITQKLTLSNRVGGDGNVYIRTGRGRTYDSITWEPWATLQTNINAGIVASLDEFTDNGIYSGVLIDLAARVMETFLLVVINDYAVKGEYRQISQFKYAMGTNTGVVSYTTRYLPSNSSVWTPWEDINGQNIERAIKNAINGVVDSAPVEYDTLRKVAEWINDDAERMAARIQANADAIEAETERTGEVESRLEGYIDSVKGVAARVDGNAFSATANEVKLTTTGVDTSKNHTVTLPAATTEKAGVMSAEDKREQVKKSALENGDIIVGQAREIHSRNGKNDSANFLVRTTAGSGTIGDGVATLKSVGGNIVKNIVDGTFEFGWEMPNANSGTFYTKNRVATITSTSTAGLCRFRAKLPSTIDIKGHVYYQSVKLRCSVAPSEKDVIIGVMNSSATVAPSSFAYAKTTTDWQLVSVRYTGRANTDYGFVNIYDTRKSNWGVVHVKDSFVVNLTEMFGAGKEPTKEECDRLFGCMDALPQGLSIANPSVFKSTGWNQFNPNMVLEGKTIVDGSIVDGDKTLAIIPCLPCKIGEGENNGYHIHGEFGEDIKVYLTPLNPTEVTGELYMHELTLSEKGTYVPQIKGYMIVEVPTTANLCAHFLWSEDCDKNAYEPYYESVVELPKIPEMSEYGLAGIKNYCDTINLEGNKYNRNIEKIVLDGSQNWTYQANNTGYFNDKILRGREAYPNLILTDAKINLVAQSTTSNYGTISIGGGAIHLNYNEEINALGVAAFKDWLRENPITIYYVLAKPDEYPLPKVNNNYTSSDYGVEQFDGGVPCNANNLYYMRSLAGETRNFLDKMYANTGKESSKEVADYITESRSKAEEAPNLALRALFVAAGAEYNDTNNVIAKTAPWGDSVEHLPKHYYLNGLGDITEEQMMDIYTNTYTKYDTNVFSNFLRVHFENIQTRTNLRSKTFYLASNENYDLSAALYNNIKTEVFVVNYTTITTKTKLAHAFTNSYIKHIVGALEMTDNYSDIFSTNKYLETLRLNKLKFNLKLTLSSNIRKGSILYIIQNATPTSAITITLHPDAYARLKDDADIVAALAAQTLVTLASA